MVDAICLMIFLLFDRMIERIAWAKTSFFRFFKIASNDSQIVRIKCGCLALFCCASHLHRATIRFNINFNEYELCDVNCNYNYNSLSHQIHLFDLQRTAVLFIAFHLWRYAHSFIHTSLNWPQVLKIRLGVNVEWVFV